ncbi:MAG: phosphotransferase family protein [Dehalococcoidia bacterium]
MTEQIETYLRHKMPQVEHVAVSGLFRIPGGASRETWSFDARWREKGREKSQGFIMRRDPDASVLETEREVEYRVLDKLWRTPVPVPKMFWLEDDRQWLDRPFVMMERLDDCETSPLNVATSPLYAEARPHIARRFVEVLAHIHKLDWKKLGLEFLGIPPSPAHCAPMEIDKWERVLDQEALEPQPVLRAAFRWLRKHLPAPAQKIVLVHGDYRAGNFLYDTRGDIKAVLDWEMVHLGDPMEDVAWACIRPWRWAGGELVGSIIEREEFYRLYEELSGNKVDRQAIRFWEVLGNVKLAAILLTGGRSFCEGRTRNIMMSVIAISTKRLELEIMELMGV